VSTTATLPASGLSVWAREPVGADELLVYESDRSPVDAMLALVRRLGFQEIGRHWDEEDGEELEFELRISDGA